MKFNALFTEYMISDFYPTESEAVNALTWLLSNDDEVTSRHYCDNKLTECVSAGSFVFHAELKTPFGDFKLFQLSEEAVIKVLSMIGMSNSDIQKVAEAATNWDPNWEYGMLESEEAEEATLKALQVLNGPASKQSLMALCGRY